MTRIFKKPNPRDKQRYLRYDDVFLGGNKPRENSRSSSSFSQKDSRFEDYPQKHFQNDDDYYYAEEPMDEFEEVDEQDYEPRNRQEPEYFSNRNSIIDEKMIRYQRRHLPPLQRYSPNAHRDNYSEFNQSYWDEDQAPKKSQHMAPLKQLWHKFILTFASIISLVCVSWIVYNWNGKAPTQTPMTQDGIPLIEPEYDSFKVLPQTPGGANIAYKDKTVYERVNSNVAVPVQESLLPPQDEIADFPNQGIVEEYSIIDDKTYYIKISAGKAKPILQNELKLLKKKFSEFVDDSNCSIKKVSNANGEKKYAILIGPFDSQESAIDIAKGIGGQCYVISVRE